MSQVHTVELSATPPQPWRNGGGTTHELLAWPPGATAWRVRVSVARIDANGPFSRFDGVQRWFAVLDGAGVVLQRPGGPVSLTPASTPLGFDGAEAPGCQLIAGPTHDLNLMALAGAGRAGMARVVAGQALAGAHRWRGLYTAVAARLHTDQGPALVLPAHSLAWADEGLAPAWHCTTATATTPTTALPAWWLTLDTA